MFLEFITLLILVAVVVSYILLARKLNNDKTLAIIEKTNLAAEKALETSHIFVDSQRNVNRIFEAFDKKLDALSRFVDAHSTNVAFQQEQFHTLARSDMLSARREELLRTKELKVALERLMGVAFISKQPPAPNDVLALENLTNRIEELETLLDSE